MRFTLAIPALAAFALAACGGSDDNADAGLSIEDGVAELASSIRQLPGQYETTSELIDFSIPGISDEQAAMMRSTISSSLAQGNSYCLTAEEAEKGIEGALKEMSESDCVFNRLDVSGGNVQAEMQCISDDGQEGAISLAGSMTETTSDMEMTVNQRVAGEGNVQMKARIASKRVGECS